MVKIENVIILTGKEKPYEGECSADFYNKADCVISIIRNENTGINEVKIIKQRDNGK